MATKKKNPHPERGTLIDSYDFDDGRLTFVKTYARFDKDGDLEIEEWFDRYGEERGGSHTFRKQSLRKLRSLLNQRLKPKRRKK